MSRYTCSLLVDPVLVYYRAITCCVAVHVHLILW